MKLTRLLHLLVLPWLLLLAQQGALMHALSHHTVVEASSKGHQPTPAQDEFCELCLAFGQVASTANVTLVAALLLIHLAFTLLPAPLVHSIAMRRVFRRNRDPPLAL